MRNTLLSISMFAFSSLFSTISSALSISSTTTSGVDLVNALLGTGISVDTGSINYIGVADQSGFFEGGLASGLGFDSGIIMTTGNATDAPGPNSLPNTGTTVGTGPDPDLNDIIWNPSGQPPSTWDRAVLEFNFTASGGDLFINFAFASEEYSEEIGVNDPFALYIDGTNIALLPDLSPVSINNVNCGNPPGSTGPNCEYFNDNSGGLFDMEYDGFTDAFTASVTGLSAGSHSMKIAIADASDTIFDSAVFLQAGSLSGTETTTVPVPAAVWLFGSGLLGLIGAARRTPLSREAGLPGIGCY